LIDDGPGTVASTDEFATELDERQYAAGWGPCLAAAESGQIVAVDEVASETNWPEFIKAANAVGLGSSLSVPLPVQQHITGALNVYSKTAHAFDTSDRRLARSFATHAALALAQAYNHTHAARQAETLQEAMRSRAVIEQAKGILMAARQCSDDEAFDVLVRLSQSQHRKLREVAADVVSRASAQPISAD
jgi:GAF domain-containing protein